MFAMGYEKTGLGRRIALALMKKMGGTALGIAYAVSFADLALAPFTPSNTARSGGTVYPIAINIPPMYQSFPEEGRRKIGAFLMWNCLAVCAVTSSMFVTASTPPILAISMVHKAAPHLPAISWMEWFIAVAPACIVLFLATPLLSYIIFPPSEKRSPEAPKWAAAELEKLGPISRREITMTLIAFGALGMWIGGSKYMNATMVGIVAVCLLMILDVVKWEDILSNKNAWNTLAWFATLISMASGLDRVGFVKWFSGYSASYFAGSSIILVMIGMAAVFYFAHYFFASLVAHVVAMLPVMLATALAVPNMDIRVFGMLLIGSIGMMSMLTPYAGGPSGIYYNSRYVTPKEFWTLGAIFGVIYFTVYLGIFMIWMPMVL
jgi:L-tartrate/succinate antiporter